MVANYWDRKAETAKPEELKDLQEKRLKHLAKYVYEKSPFYRKKFDQEKIKPADVKKLEDITKLPFTLKSDLRDNYPFNLFCVPMEHIVRIHASSGTTGKPTVVGYTKSDLDMWTDAMARTIVTAGGSKHDILHNAYGYGLFTGGLGFHYGGERVGCAVIPVSGGNTKRQLLLLKDFGGTIISCTPSYSIYLAEAAASEGMDPKKDFKLRVGIFGAEPWTDAMRRRIEDLYDIDALDVYGLSEVCGPGVAQECPEKNGSHIWSDYFYPEVIDPDTCEVLGEGEQGELVFTTLTKEGIPLIRYRTRDLTVLEWDKCGCGRWHPRMKKVRGRSDDMLIIRGVNVFPSQIEHVLLKFPGVASHYMLVLRKKGPLDALTVQVEVPPAEVSDRVKDMMKMRQGLTSEIEHALGISVDVELMEPGTIQRSEGKAVRVKDERG